MPDYRIITPCGPLRGTECRWPGVAAYLGIRYASAGRFEYPVVTTGWEGEYDAFSYGNCCYQPRAFRNEEHMPDKAFYYREFRRGEYYSYSEDCLFLNVWTPSEAGAGSRLPVIFYIHGGAFRSGCGHEKPFDGPVWPVKGAVAVTINYRLGPLGFLTLPQLKEEAGRTGNYGLYDQIAALHWVKRNISAFGGDPDNITVMGQSAGAVSVQQLCLSPLTGGLFARAVMSSGGGIGSLMPVASAESRYPFWQKVTDRAGCRTLSELRAVSVETLFSAWDQVREEHPEEIMADSPCEDHHLITGVWADKKIPYLLGSNSEDMMPGVLQKMARDWCVLQDSRGGPPSYAYFFKRQLPGDDKGAWHSADLWYWFGTLENCWRPMTEYDRQLSGQMVDHLIHFARTGNPNGDGLCFWKPVSRNQTKALCLGEGAACMGDVDGEELNQAVLTEASG